MKHLVGIVWFREDLRLLDNHALYFATQKCSQIIGVYHLNIQGWHDHATAACRVEFTLRGLNALQEDLKKYNIPLIILKSENNQDLANDFLRLMKQHQATALFFNRQYEINESRRDQIVEKLLESHEIHAYSYDDTVIIDPAAVRTAQGSFFKVFTPYKNAWYRCFEKKPILKLLPSPKKQSPLAIAPAEIPLRLRNFKSTIDKNLWPSGESSARKRLDEFIDQKISNYQKTRDFPALSGTSLLSPYLATGMLSPRECFLAAYQANNKKLTTGNTGIITWMNELIWRDFYKSILIAAPRVSMNKPYQLRSEKLNWHYDESLLEAWQRGKTGYPIVDAAMRQLNSTGWMHNRLRMITAMFLAKNLFLDWRLGESYFMNQLIDGDLAANNGGWQWCASTGVDAVPYFRVFNPVTQSERFDPQGAFIRQYCPELASLNNLQIHDPTHRAPLLLKKLNYPQAIVDLKYTRQRFIDEFKKTITN